MTATQLQTIPSPGGGVYGSMAYWNHNLYVLSNSSKMRCANSPCRTENSRSKRQVVPISQLSAQPRLFRRTVRGMVCFGCCTRKHGTPTTRTRCCSPSTPSIPPGCSTSVSRIRLATAPGWPFGSIFQSSQTVMSMWEQSAKLMSTACCLTRGHAKMNFTGSFSAGRSWRSVPQGLKSPA